MDFDSWYITIKVGTRIHTIFRLAIISLHHGLTFIIHVVGSVVTSRFDNNNLL